MAHRRRKKKVRIQQIKKLRSSVIVYVRIILRLAYYYDTRIMYNGTPVQRECRTKRKVYIYTRK